jgi:hypothetical protein
MADEQYTPTHMWNDAAGQPEEPSGWQNHKKEWETFATCAVRLIPVLKAQMAAVTQETERSAVELTAQLRRLVSSDWTSSDEERAASLSKVVMALQFQDITRQKLEHVGQALDQWDIHLQALLKGPDDAAAQRQIAALERIEESYTMEEERRLHAQAVTLDDQGPVPTGVSHEGDVSVTLF